MGKSPFFAPSQPKVEKLVEYRTAYYGKYSEFSVYETNQKVQVPLKFGNPIVCRMTMGKKYMTMPHTPTFTFLPGESMFVPPDTLMEIEFPEARIGNPTECICIEVEKWQIDNVVEKLNDARSRSGIGGELKLNTKGHSLFRNTPLIDHQIDKLMHIYRHEDSPYRDALIELNISELIVRVLQANAQGLLMAESSKDRPDTGLAAAIDFIKRNPARRISLDELSSVACMSQATLYRSFKTEFGISPAQFITQVKIRKACEMLSDPHRSVTSVCFDLGFSNVGHFIGQFRKQIGETPKKYQQNSTH